MHWFAVIPKWFKIIKTSGFEFAFRCIGSEIGINRITLIPIHEVRRNHWTLVKVDPIAKIITYFDSLGTHGQYIRTKILDFLETWFLQKKGAFDRSQWKTLSGANEIKNVQQSDGTRLFYNFWYYVTNLWIINYES